VHTQFLLEILNEREQLEDASVASKIVLKRMLKQQNEGPDFLVLLLQ